MWARSQSRRLGFPQKQELHIPAVKCSNTRQVLRGVAYLQLEKKLVDGFVQRNVRSRVCAFSVCLCIASLENAEYENGVKFEIRDFSPRNSDTMHPSHCIDQR